MRFYIDGVGELVGAFDPEFTSTTPVAIGARGDNLTGSFLGSIDEISVYDRALAASLIEALYEAGNAGKCVETRPPRIVGQPESVEVVAGSAIALMVHSLGTQPFSYQWWFNGSALAGATQSALELPVVQLDQAGDYWVVVSNAGGADWRMTPVL